MKSPVDAKSSIKADDIVETVCDVTTDYLDPLRALAAYWVLTAHCMIWGGADIFSLPNPKLAVALFMIISGFLMSHGFTNRAQREPPNEWRTWANFYLRRYARIAPAYYLSLLCAVFLSRPFLGGYEVLRERDIGRWIGSTAYNPSDIHFSLGNILSHLTFAFGLSPTGSFSTFLPDWSLSLEMQFYAVFPILFISANRIGLIWVATFAVAVTQGSVRFYAILVRDGIATQFVEPSPLVFNLQWFVWGMLIFEIANKPAGKLRLLLISVFISWLAVRHAGVEAFVLVAFAWLLQISALGRLPAISNVGIKRALRRASDASYSVYLFHGFALSIVGSRIATFMDAAHYSREMVVFAIWVAVSIITWPLAAIIHAYVERPFITLAHRKAKIVGLRGEPAI